LIHLVHNTTQHNTTIMVLIRYISPQGLEALKLYRYHCDDKSLVAFYIMQPFWRWAVNLLPIWIAYVTMAWIGLDWIGLLIDQSLHGSDPML
jgi:hypothetical protein